MPFYHDHGLKMGLKTRFLINNPGYSISTAYISRELFEADMWKTVRSHSRGSKLTVTHCTWRDCPTGSQSVDSGILTDLVHESVWPLSCFVTLSLSDLFCKMGTAVRPYWNLIGQLLQMISGISQNFPGDLL